MKNVLYVHKKQHLNSMNIVFSVQLVTILAGKKRISSSYLFELLNLKDQLKRHAKKKMIHGPMQLIDLIDADARYHHKCSVNFRTHKQIPVCFERALQNDEMRSKRPKIGKPIEEDRKAAFEQVVKYFKENDQEQLTIIDLVNKMRTLNVIRTMQFT